MTVSAIVMSGANQYFEPRIKRFATAHYHTEDVGIMYTPNNDERRRTTADVRRLAASRSAFRQIIETKIDQAFYASKMRNHFVGVIMLKVRLCRCSTDFRECVEFARAEHAEVLRWKLFPELHVVCIAPDHEIAEIQM